MTQNVPITPGVGITVLADSVTDPAVGNVPAAAQYVKIMDATPGSINKAVVNPNGAFVMAPYGATALGYQQITTLSGAVGLTVPTGATFAIILVEGISVRWRDDGVNPTTSVGMPMYAGQAPEIFAGDLTTAKFIQESGSNGQSTLNVSYYK